LAGGWARLGEAGRSAVGRAVGLVLKGARGAAGNFLVRTRAWGGRGRARLNLSVTNPFDIIPESKKIFVSSPPHPPITHRIITEHPHCINDASTLNAFDVRGWRKCQ
jgi:hypothetical protein